MNMRLGFGTQTFLACVLACFGAQPAFASTTKTAIRVTVVEAGAEAIYIQVAGGHVGESCGSDEWAIIPRVMDGVERPAWEQQMDLAVAALLSGRQVDLVLDKCRNAAGTTSGGTTYPVVKYIR